MFGTAPSKAKIVTAPDDVLAMFNKLGNKTRGKRTKDIPPQDKALVLALCKHYGDTYSEASMEEFLQIGRGSLYSYRTQPAVMNALERLNIPVYTNSLITSVMVDAAVPKVIACPDRIPQSARDMQEAWLAKNTPSRGPNRFL